MKRMQLFEFEDFHWFPRWLRDLMTDSLVWIHQFLGTASVVAPLLKRLMHLSGEHRIVDLCSGGGGPMPEVLRRLHEDGQTSARIVLTDLYPSEMAARRMAKLHSAITYHPQSVNAGSVPASLDGIRTMICSFHHMPLPVARKILQDAFENRQPILIYEISDNSHPKYLWWLALPVNFLLVLVVTPFFRPFSWRRLFFTYVLPLLPLVIAWDGTTSNARTYTREDLQELTKSLMAKDYSWEIKTIRQRPNPGPMLCLMGIPQK